MASTVTQVVAKFRRTYPDCGDTRAGELFADTHREILVRLRLRETVVSISLTDGTREYDLGDTTLLVNSAVFVNSATDGDYIVLDPTSIDHLDYDDPTWRARLDENSPSTYYIRNVTSSDTSKQVIGFDPIPDTTTSGGYPIVKVYCQQEATITTSETVPPQLLSDQIYIYKMAQMYSAEKDRKQYPFWNALYEEEYQRNLVHIKNRIERLETQFIPKSNGFMSSLT